jgi:hypothetical protein
MQAVSTQRKEELERLLSDYVALCNRAIAENEDAFWVRQAKRLNRALWGGASFRALVYDENPSDPLAAFVIHFDADDGVLSLASAEEHEVAFTWAAPLRYLEDVVRERPRWYLDHPTRLDWSWLEHRVRDEAAHRFDGRSFAVGALLGAAVASLVGTLLGRRRRRRTLVWR